MSFRDSLERASLPAARWLSGLPRAVPFVVVLGLMVAGIFVPGWGWVFFVPVLLFLGWLLVLGWPRLTPPERMLRAVVLLMVIAVMVTRAFPKT